MSQLSRKERLHRAISSQRGNVLFPKLDLKKVEAIPVGQTYLRILPWDAKDTDAPPMVAIGRYYLNDEFVPDLDIMVDLGADPVARFTRKMKKTMDPADFKIWVSDFRSQKKFAAYTCDPSNPKRGWFITEFPKGVGETIHAMFFDSEESGVWWQKGSKYDFRIKKEGSGLGTEYSVMQSKKFADVPSPNASLVDLDKVYALSETTEFWQRHICKLLGEEFEDLFSEKFKNKASPKLDKKEVQEVEDEEEDVPEEVEDEEEDVPEEVEDEEEDVPEEVEDDEDEEVEDDEDEEEDVPEDDEDDEEVEDDEDEEEDVPKYPNKKKIPKDDEADEDFSEDGDEGAPKSNKGAKTSAKKTHAVATVKKRAYTKRSAKK